MKTKIIFASILFIVIVSISVLYLLYRNSIGESSANVLRVGILKHESSLPFYVARDKEFFKGKGIEVQLVELPPGDHMPALLTDRVDIISATSFPVLFGVMVENPGLVYGLFPGAEVLDGPTVYGIITRKEFKGKSIKDLTKGVILAINPFTQINIQTIFNCAGIDKSQMPEIRVANREAAIKAVSEGSASAAIMDQPALAVALASNQIKLLESNPRAKYIGNPYWSGSGAVKVDTWIRRKKDIQILLSAIDQSVGYTREHNIESHLILAKALGIDTTIASQMGGYYFPYTNDTVPLPLIDSTVTALLNAGLLKSHPDLTILFPKGLYGQK
jgi:ABC-type nitrate/sulfonate/bicarbonate transport system substrate-binding protein